MPAPPCHAQNRRGEPCRAPAKANGYCASHDPDVPAEQRFGSPQQARAAATGVKRRYPRLREVVEERLEAQADRIVGAQLEALDATRLIVGEDGSVHMHPDYLTRLRAGDTLLSRALGKPAQSVELNGEMRAMHVHLDAADPHVRTALHALLRMRPAIEQ